MLTLPRFDYDRRNDDPPHRKYILAECIVPYVAIRVRVRLVTNNPHSRWWITATKILADGCEMFRATNGVSTSSRRKADQWRTMIEAGNVMLADR